MRYLKNIVVCMLVGVMLVMTGCQNTEKVGNTSKESAASVDNGTLDKDSTVIAVGCTKVTYNEYQMYSYFLKKRYESVMSSAVWNVSTGANRTVGLDAVEDTVRMIIQLKVITREAVKAGVVLTVDEKEEVAYESEKYVKSIPAADRTKYGITAKLVAKVLEDNALARKMYDVVTGKVNVTVTPEEMKVVKVQLIDLMIKGTDKNGQVLNVTGQAKTELYEKAKQLQRKAKSAQSMYSLAVEQSSLLKVVYDLGREDKPKELVDAAFKLKKGQVSEVITTADGYYIACCIGNNDKKQDALHKEEVIVEKQTVGFQSKYTTWSSLYDVRVSKSLIADKI